MVDLTQVKAGDRVWVGWGQWPRGEGIKTVARTTPAFVLLDYNGDGRYLPKFYKDSGYQYGGGGGKYLTGIATHEECVQWDQEQAAKRARKDEKQHIRTERAAKAKEMSELFDLNVVVGDCHNTKGQEQGLWDVHFHDLSEVAVRALAGIIKSSAVVRAER